MSNSKTTYTDPEIGDEKNSQETPSFVIESLEPRVPLSATLANVLGSDDVAELEAEADAGGDAAIADLAVDGEDFFDSDNEHKRGGASGGIVTPPIQAPDTTVDHFHAGSGELVTGNVLDNDIDPDNDPLSTSLAVGPARGTLTLDEDGSFAYVPDNGFSGLDRFWYQVDDGNGHAEQVEFCVFIDAPPNDVPDAEDDVFSTAHGQPVSGSLIDNDLDLDGDFSAALWKVPSNGTVTVNEDGTFEYTPNQGFSGEDTFVYRIIDTDGSANIATVSIFVDEPDDNAEPLTQVE